MVSSVLFYQVHQRLNEIFGVSTDLPFAGLPVLVCGDLYQLLPIKGAPIYSSTDNIKRYLSLELWSVLNLKIGAQVMLTININLEDRLVNGLVGRAMYLRYVNDEVKVIYMKFNDQNAGQQAIQPDIFARQRNWVLIQKYETTFLIKKNKLQPSIKRTQFPLVLSSSCTAHKVQGLSLSDGVISYDLQRQKSFNQGQMYVAMSRISKLENMHLIGNYNRNAIKVNKSAKKEYERLYSACLLSPLSFPKASNDTLTIALLNTRSLRRHSENILNDVDLIQNDILCLTKTQLYLNEDTSDITTKFQNNSQCITTLALIIIEVMPLGIRVTYFSVKVQIFVACHL